MSKKRSVLVGISGGIDSAAAVLLLKREGYEVTGLYIEMHSPLENREYLEEILGIEIIIHKLYDKFESTIINSFVEAYMQGSTPSPCVECNDKIKWQEIYDIATEMGFDYWATGHYCRKTTIDNKHYITRGRDNTKDQSYYLWRVGQRVLSGALFPLGERTKQEIYSLMREWGHLPLVERPQSMGVCFLRGRNYNDFISERIPDIATLDEGDVVDTQGRVVAHHRGYPFYTLAQKRGLEIPKELCVVEIDAKQNRLTVGTKESLYTKTLTIKDWRFVDPESIESQNNIRTIVRGIGLNPEGFSTIVITSPTTARVELDGSAWAVMAGQPVVFYQEDLVVGGGYISDQ